MNEYTFTPSNIGLKQEAKAAKFAGQIDVDGSSNSVFGLAPRPQAGPAISQALIPITSSSGSDRAGVAGNPGTKEKAPEPAAS